MKLLAFTDLHCDSEGLESIKKKIKENKIDFLICCGDASVWGNGLNEVAKEINKLNIITLIIPGNHETPEEVRKICNKYKNFINLHEVLYEFNDYTFVGFGTGGFSYTEPRLEKLIIEVNKKLNKEKKLIFVTHAPIYNTKLDYLYSSHRGCKSSRKFIEKFKPVITFCGHFHENENKKDKIKNSLIINPGHKGTLVEI